MTLRYMTTDDVWTASAPEGWSASEYRYHRQFKTPTGHLVSAISGLRSITYPLGGLTPYYQEIFPGVYVDPFYGYVVWEVAVFLPGGDFYGCARFYTLTSTNRFFDNLVDAFSDPDPAKWQDTLALGVPT